MPEPFLQAEQLATGHCRHFFIFKPGHALKGLLAFSVFTAEMGPLKNAYVPSLGVAVCTQVGVSPGRLGLHFPVFPCVHWPFISFFSEESTWILCLFENLKR